IGLSLLNMIIYKEQNIPSSYFLRFEPIESSSRFVHSKNVAGWIYQPRFFISLAFLYDFFSIRIHLKISILFDDKSHALHVPQTATNFQQWNLEAFRNYYRCQGF